MSSVCHLLRAFISFALPLSLAHSFSLFIFLTLPPSLSSLSLFLTLPLSLSLSLTLSLTISLSLSLSHSQVCSDVDKQLIFDEIIPSAHLLMTDVFGNYVLQKLFEVRNILLHYHLSEFLHVILHLNGYTSYTYSFIPSSLF